MIRGNTVFAFLFFVVSFTAGIFMGASFPREWGQVGGWMHDWQTLVAGSIAIAAAALTVQQMRLSDKEAEKRHKKIIALNLRSDALKVDRAYSSQIKHMRKCLGELNDASDEVSPINSDSLSTYEIKLFATRLDWIFNLCDGVVNNRSLKDANLLLGGAGTDAFKNFTNSWQMLTEINESLVLSARFSYQEGILRPVEDKPTENTKKEWDSARKNLHKMKESLAEYISEIEKLHATYEEALK